MRRNWIAILLIAACGEVSAPGGDGDGGPGGADGGQDPDGGVAPDADPISLLSVSVEAALGGGTVVSDVDGINCGDDCGEPLATGSEVTLTAVPDPGSVFVAWRGDARDCRRPAECTFTMNGPKSVGALFAEIGTTGWSIHVASTVGDDGGQAVIDRNGDIIFAATFGGTFSLAGQEYDSHGSRDIFLAKLSPGGEVIWARALGGEDFDSLAAIAADPTTGDVVVSGYYSSPQIDLGGPTMLDNNDTEDLFVARYAGETGAWVWQKPILVSDVDGPSFNGLGVDGSGDVLVSGHFNTSVNLGAGALSSIDQEMFLAKLEGTDGAVEWQRKLGGTESYASASQLVVDSEGNPILVGSFSQTVDFDGQPGNDMSSAGSGSRDAFIAKFAAANGALTWQRQVGGTQTDDGRGIALGPNDSVTIVVNYSVVAGEVVGFLGNNLAGSGTGTDLVVGRLSSNGGFTWAKRFGSAGNEFGARVGSFPDGRVAVTGNFSATFSMDGEAVTFEGANYDSFFGVLASSNGAATWATRVGSPVQDAGAWVAGYDSTLYAFGVFIGEGSFLGATLTNQGTGNDVYGLAVPLP